jgi:hypothetical protein
MLRKLSKVKWLFSLVAIAPAYIFGINSHSLDSAIIDLKFSNNTPDSVRRIVLIYNSDRLGLCDSTLNLTVKIAPKPNSTSQVRLPDNGKIRKIQAIIFEFPHTRYTTDAYIVEPGDSIVMNIRLTNKRPIIKFAGKGSEKYNCRRSIESDEESCRDRIISYTDSIGDIYHWSSLNFKYIINSKKISRERALGILSSYRKILSKKVYQTFEADIIQETTLDIMSYIISYYELCDSTDLKVVRHLYHHLKPIEPIFDSSIYNLSPNYVRYRIFYPAMQIYLLKPRKTYPKFSEIYALVKKERDKELRERMLMILILDIFSPPYFASHGARLVDLSSDQAKLFIQDAMESSRNISIRNKIAGSSLLKTSPGVTAFPFVLPDVSGNKIRLRDYLGKVVLLDFWSTGCAGCSSFYKTIVKSTIIPTFRHNNQFALISICTDPNKEMWKKSLKEKIFADEDETNVYTDGKGFEHEIISYYGLTGLPCALLIDRKGKILRNLTYSSAKEIINSICKGLGN